ncbi:unnamed protein product [Nippostrongylus brasiliensis]|uniref:G3BP-like protein n=1 Tax=Nippostrongylus brasiliensis TaxID=27835 RepID=A0A0N4YJ05_NIPBR|nr:hypothetical protein Q1695_004819 [Nippostrongylus brasiliensis]VDL80516.1 unnamed protein product [Nippostrongylus brasiliensis]
MKMNVVDDLVIRSEPAYTESDPTPDAIGLEFVRQYYTILSKSPGCVHKFYSHESVFVHNDVTVVGQQKIKNCIEQLVEANNRFKIHSVKGSFTSHKGIVLQVCGEVATRRFFQTFILGQQSAKKFYVQNDIFQFVDVAFHSESQNSPAPPAQNEAAVTEAQSVDIDLVQNGHNHSHSSIALSCEETPILTSVVSHAKASPAKNMPPPSAPEENLVKEALPPEEIRQVKAEQPADASPVTAPVDTTPKTWAHRVGGGAKLATTPATGPPSQKASTPAPPSANITPSTRPQQAARPPGQTNGGPIAQGERRIYLGGIVRNMVPDSTTIAEQEIKDAFSKFGEVESVAIPRKVLDQPNDTSRNGFAFISMRTPTDAQNVFQKARKDDRGIYHLRLVLDAFGFDGEVTISEQKDRIDRPGGGFRGGRGGFVPRGGAGGSFSRGGVRGRGGGGFRGGFVNQNSHH